MKTCIFTEVIENSHFRNIGGLSFITFSFLFIFNILLLLIYSQSFTNINIDVYTHQIISIRNLCYVKLILIHLLPLKVTLLHRPEKLRSNKIQTRSLRNIPHRIKSTDNTIFIVPKMI